MINSMISSGVIVHTFEASCEIRHINKHSPSDYNHVQSRA